MRRVLRQTKGKDLNLRSPARPRLEDCHPEAAFSRSATFLLAAALFYTFFALNVQAQDGHARWHHYYQEWKQPGTQASCCNARVTFPGGAEEGDCEPARAEMRNGDWYAWERHLAQWLRVPDSKIVRERNPSGEEGHLCWSPYAGILCFVPPDTGG